MKHLENEFTYLYHEYVILSSMLSELNWDVINVMSQENLGPCSGMWNDHDVLYKGLQFDNKKDL